MFTNLFSTLKAWIATSTGAATVAVFFTIGLILTILFVIALYNIYSELMQSRKAEVKLRENLNDSNEQLAKERDAVRILESRRSELSTDLSAAQEKANTVPSLIIDRDHFKEASESAAQQSVLDNETIKQLNEELGAERNGNATLLERIGFLGTSLRAVNLVLGSIVKSKVAVVKSYAFNFKDYEGDVGTRLSGIEFEDTVGASLGFDSDHKFTVTTNQVSDFSERVLKRLHDVTNDLANREGLLSPVFYAQVIYIRSLDLKVILTDFAATPADINDENRDSLIEFYTWINGPSVIRRSGNTIVLNRDTWNAMEDDAALSLITPMIYKNLHYAVDRLKNDSLTTASAATAMTAMAN